MQQQQQQQVGTAAYRKNEGNEKDIDHQMREQDEDDDAESTGSKGLVQMIQEAENQSAANRFRRFPLWNSNLDNVSDLYAPRKQGRQPRLVVGFNSDGDDDVGGKGDRNISAQTNVRDWVVRCQVIVSVLSIVVGVVTCIVLVLALGDNALHADKRNDPNKEQSSHYSTNQQEMLRLAEQVTIACGVSSSSSMSTCKELCHNHMCCVVQDDEYSCKSDVTKDCAVYAGCVEGMVQIIWDGNNTKDKPQLATTGAGDESDCFSACNDSRIAALIAMLSSPSSRHNDYANESLDAGIHDHDQRAISCPVPA
eukprot:scaffold40167_cov150-Skeletonema_dohrnii-CCMP3373.AAC.2